MANIYLSWSTGNDSNPGTEAEPKKSIDASLYNRAVSAGDRFYLKRGDVWELTDKRGIVTNNNFTEESERVIIDAYGTGDKPLIKCSTTLSGSWGQHDPSGHPNVYNLDISSYAYSTCYLMWEDDSLPLRPGNDEDSLTSSRMYYYDTAADVIYVRCSDDADPSTHVIDFGQQYLGVSCDNDYYTFKNLAIKHAYAGIDVQNSDYANVENCEIYYHRQNGITAGGDNGIIRYNEIYGCWNGRPYGSGGVGYGINPKGKNCLIHNNYVYDNYINIISTGDCAGTKIYYNLVKDALVNCIDVGTHAVVTGDNLQIFNNTIYHEPDVGGYGTNGHGISTQGGAQDVTYANNLIIAYGTDAVDKLNCVSMNTDHPATITLDNNLYYPTGTAFIGGLQSAPYYTMEDWLAITKSSGINGFGGNDPEINSISADPVVDSNYKIQAGSPCINAGRNSLVDGMISVVDYWDNEITDGTGTITVSGGIVDIGAYEYFPTTTDTQNIIQSPVQNIVIDVAQNIY